MQVTKFDYSKSTKDIFYKIIYPIYAKEFWFGSSYEEFVSIVSTMFILNSKQWEYVLEHWESKQSILEI
jgi:hypothetical protein